MPLVRGDSITYTTGNDRCADIVTDGTYLYSCATPTASTARVIKSTMYPLAELSVATLTFPSGSSAGRAGGITVLGGYAFTTHANLTSSIANAGVVIKTDTSTMIEDSSTQLWSPGVGSERQSAAIYNDGTWIYVGSSAYDPGSGWLATKVTQMDTGFGSQTEVSLSTVGSTILPSSVDGDGSHVYFAISRGPTTDPTDSVVKLSVSGMTEVAKWNAPAGVDLAEIICVPPKLYVGTLGGLNTPGYVYRIDAGSMTLDRIVITQPSGVAGLMYANGILYVSDFEFNATLFMYNAATYERLGTLQFLPTSGGGTTIGIFDPNSQNTVQFWGVFGSSPGGICSMKNVYTGPSSTYPTSQQPTVATGGVSGVIEPVIPTTGSNIAAFTSAIPSGPGVTTQLSSANPFIQASLMGDPHFYGFEGESFFFNGEVGNYYNLFSDDGIQINTLFRYWETSAADNFTAMEEIGITIIPSKVPKLKNSKQKLFKKVDEIRIKITANDGVMVNDEYVCDSFDPIFEFVKDIKTYFTEKEIEKFKNTEGYGNFIKAYVIRFWPYNFIITVCDDYVNEYHPALNPPYLNIIARLDGATENRPHGILGQTADFDKKPKEKLDGEECDYKVSNLWDSNFKFNKFRR